MRVLLLQKGHNNHSKSPIKALCIIFLIATPNNNVQTEFTVLCLPRFFATATEVPLFVVIDNVNVSQLPATARAHSMIVP